MKVTLLTRSDSWCQAAAGIARSALDATVYEGDWGESLPDVFGHERIDVLLSFLAPWIVPADVLGRCKLAINFHPGDRNYPGIGCYNFALYDGAERYGAVAHHMAPNVDTGRIFMERTFRIAVAETVQSLRNRTLAVMIGMFSDVVDALPNLPPADINWSRRPFKRSDLDALCQITPDMSQDEISRRIRATSYPGKPGARLRIVGQTFHHSP